MFNEIDKLLVENKIENLTKVKVELKQIKNNIKKLEEVKPTEVNENNFETIMKEIELLLNNQDYNSLSILKSNIEGIKKFLETVDLKIMVNNENELLDITDEMKEKIFIADIINRTKKSKIGEEKI